MKLANKQTNTSVLVTKQSLEMLHEILFYDYRAVIAAIPYPAMTDLVAGAEMRCGCSVPLHSCEQSSKGLTVCVLTGRNLGPSPQYFAQGNHFHSSVTYRRKSVTMVPEMGRGHTTN